MGQSFHHLTQEERSQIYSLKSMGHTMIEISNHLGYHRSAIYRELQRNTGGKGYRYRQAQQKATERRRKASAAPRKVTPEKWHRVTEWLQQGWSPEQIAGRGKRQGEGLPGREWIYQYVRQDRREGGQLYQQLRRRGKKPNWKGGRHSGRGHIPGRQDISLRPEVVDQKERLGDLEIDTIVSGHNSGSLVSLVDRATKYLLLMLVSSRTADQVTEAVRGRLEHQNDWIRTITADNGKEFAGHLILSEALDAGIYFARPYHSWERGLNEHVNGLIREYFPKGTDFRQVTPEQVREVERRINQRPRKVLNYQTPQEAFLKAMKR